MSFSSDVKKEIGNLEVSITSYKAELYSIIRYKSNWMLSSDGLKLVIMTTLNVVARRIVFLFKKIYEVDVEIQSIKKQKLDYKTKYEIILAEHALEICKDLKVINPDKTINEQIDYTLLKSDETKSALIRGLFLVQGSINDPATSNYHLEIILDDASDFDIFNTILSYYGINMKLIERRKGYVMYLKRSEQIGDFLKFIGADNSVFYFENQRIMRDYNNSINRVINCDIANEEKMMRSAKRQLDDIEYLLKNKGLMQLSERIVNAINLRTTYPDYSLSDLSEESFDLVGKYISKSGLSHCFNDIHRLVLELKGIKS